MFEAESSSRLCSHYDTLNRIRATSFVLPERIQSSVEVEALKIITKIKLAVRLYCNTTLCLMESVRLFKQLLLP